MFVTSGTMDVRVGLLLVISLGATWACDARKLGNTELGSGNGRISEIPGEIFSRRLNLVFVLCHLIIFIIFVSDFLTPSWLIIIMHQMKMQLSCLIYLLEPLVLN